MLRIESACHQFSSRGHVVNLLAIPVPDGLCAAPARDLDPSTGTWKGLDDDTAGHKCDPLAIGRESRFGALGEMRRVVIGGRVDLEYGGPLRKLRESQVPIRRPVQVPHDGRAFHQDLRRTGAVRWNSIYIMVL